MSSTSPCAHTPISSGLILSRKAGVRQAHAVLRLLPYACRMTSWSMLETRQKLSGLASVCRRPWAGLCSWKASSPSRQHYCLLGIAGICVSLHTNLKQVRQALPPGIQLPHLEPHTLHLGEAVPAQTGRAGKGDGWCAVLLLYQGACKCEKLHEIRSCYRGQSRWRV